MKFTVAVVVLALAVCAQCSLVPLAWGGLVAAAHDDGQWHGDHLWNDGHWDPTHDLIAEHGWAHGHGWAGHGIVAPAIVAGHGLPLIAAHAHAVPVVAQGSYLAANRGSVHVAPLEGHALSASSINLQPAPGTI